MNTVHMKMWSTITPLHTTHVAPVLHHFEHCLLWQFIL